VISGPNAGGKTVVLKTVGLIALMAQSGLHVPARAADLPVFQQVSADIGDHQSIAANLSTFTAHIERVREIDAELEVPALVLLDEVGTGTDPEEGAALGVAIVDHFKERGAHVLVSTHYGPLKIYATSISGVVNASVEFDEKTLKPTYVLLTGVAGASSGIEIARRFGLPSSITERAREGVSDAGLRALDYLRRLKEQFEERAQALDALHEERAAVAEKYAKLESDFTRRDLQREQEFRTRMQSIVDDFVARAEKFLSTITETAEARRIRKDVERRTVELRAAAGTSARSLRLPGAGGQTPGSPGHAEPPSASIPSDLKSGDRVRIISLGQEGVVESVGDSGVDVRVGSLRFREEPDNLQLIVAAGASKEKRGREIKVPSGVSVNLQDRSGVSTGEIKVIGQSVNEASEAVDKFLDEAFLSGYDRVRIVHGIGMGALKRAVSELLTGHPHVEKFYAAAASEGGNGATIAELRK
jgi:DNA mismatch repair protein MutS2